MATRKSGTALQALNARIAALQAQAEVLRQKEVSGVVAKIKDAIAHYGLSAEDLGLSASSASPAKGTRKAKAAKKTRKTIGAGKSSRPAKYRDDEGHVWSGIGKRPDWFKAALAAGKSPEDLLVGS